MKLYPKKEQWRRWSFVSQFSYIGFIFGLIGVIGVIYTITKDTLSESPQKFSPKQEAQIQALYSYFAGDIDHEELVLISETINSLRDNISINSFDTILTKFDISNNLDKKRLYKLNLESYSGVLEYKKDKDSLIHKVYSCEDYANYRKYGNAMTNLDLKADSYFYGYCKLIDLLQTIKPAKRSFIRNKSINELDNWSLELAGLKNLDWQESINKLDNEYSFRFQTRGEYPPKTIQDYMFYGFIEIADIKSNSIKFLYPREYGDASFYLELLRGDLNNDEIEDLVVYVNHYDYFGGSYGFSDIQIWTMYESSKYFEVIYEASDSKVP